MKCVTFVLSISMIILFRCTMAVVNKRIILLYDSVCWVHVSVCCFGEASDLLVGLAGANLAVVSVNPMVLIWTFGPWMSWMCDRYVLVSSQVCVFYGA